MDRDISASSIMEEESYDNEKDTKSKYSINQDQENQWPEAKESKLFKSEINTSHKSGDTNKNYYDLE